MSKNVSQNSLYDQLKKDLKNQKNAERIYIPVALFKRPEEIVVNKSSSVRRKLLSALGTIVK